MDAFASGSGHRTGHGQTTASLLLSTPDRPLTETSLFLDLLGTLTSVVLLWLALYNDFKSLLQAQGGPITLLCSSSGAHATELSYQRQFLIRALLSGSKAMFTLE